jgi:hypothetical protein
MHPPSWQSTSSIKFGIGKIAPAVHRDHRSMLESGSMEQLMRFLAMRDVLHGSITLVSESTDMPINMIRSWQRELLPPPQLATR